MLVLCCVVFAGAALAGWEERGPAQGGGPVEQVTAGPGGTLLAAAGLGGLWRGSSDGSSWTHVHAAPGRALHFAAATPDPGGTGPDLLFIASFEDGAWVSVDDGASWAEPSWSPSAPSGVSVAARELRQAVDGTLYLHLFTSDSSVWRSDDGGQSFTRLGGTAELETPWVERLPGGAADVVHAALDCAPAVSTDRGLTWTTLGPGGEGCSPRRLSGSEAGAPRLYWQSEALVLGSDDAGESWSVLQEGEPGFDGPPHTWVGSAVDAELVLAQEAYSAVPTVSRDGGASFARPPWWDEVRSVDWDGLADARVVPDGAGRERWLLATSRGPHESTNGLLTVSSISGVGLQNGVHHSILTDPIDPSQALLGGMGSGLQWAWQEEAGALWSTETLWEGQVGHLSSSDPGHALVYGGADFGLLVRHGEGPEGVSWFAQEGWMHDQLLPAVVADPGDPERVYVPGKQLWVWERTEAGGSEWAPAAVSSQRFDATDPSDELALLAFAPDDPQRLVGLSRYGQVWRSTDKGESWRAGAELGLYVSSQGNPAALVVDPGDGDHLLAGGTSYSGATVFESWDGGESWEEADQGLDVQARVVDLGIASDGTAYAATLAGLMVRWSGAAAWTPVDRTGGPETAVSTLEVLGDGTVRVGAWGRGVWDVGTEPPGCVAGIDQDRDGVDCPEDCDDENADRAPGRDEVCGDGIDQDCDGSDLACDPVEDTGTAAEDEPAPDEEPGADAVGDGEDESATGGAKGSGCSAAGGGGGSVLAWAALLLLRRRRPR
jgi:uncharacterized protein (TIGR03382 family)